MTYCLPGGEGFLAEGDRIARIACSNPGMESAATRFHILAQTPRSVWEEYRSNGYSIHEAVKEEMSYL